jgi:tripartite ATP-independent transporter DctM subunit
MMVEPTTVGIIGTLLVFVLLFAGMPIAFAMMLVGFLGMAYLTSLTAALPVVARTTYEVAAFYPYMVMPLFVVMGGFASTTGLTQEMYNTFDKWFRRLPGGLGITTVAACAGFAAISGSSVATAAAMGKLAYPEMKRFGYDDRLSTGCIAAGGTLGFLIPPSLGFVVYGILTEQSIGKLLIAGVIPGLILASAYAAIVIFWVKINRGLAPGRGEPVPWREKLRAAVNIWEPLALFILVMGGIYFGFFTPTEAGAVGATALFLIALLKRKLNWRKLVAALEEVARIAAMVQLLVIGATIFSYFLALSTIPMEVATWVGGLQTSPYVIHAFITIIFLFLGCFMDVLSMLVLTMPVIFPVIMALGFDPIWFGVIAVLVMEAGLITPPVGLNIFTVAGVAEGVPVETVFRGAAPFLLAILFMMVVITIFPGLATFLPGLMMR